MDRRTFLGSAATAGAVVLAGCSADDSGNETDSPADGGGPTTSEGEATETPPDDSGTPMDDASEPETPVDDSETPADDSETPMADSETSETLPESEVVELSGPPCEAVAGATFKSIEKREGGLGPDGEVAQVHWSVRFENGGFQYYFSDVVDSGTYSCTVEDGKAHIQRDSGSDGAIGIYDPETGVLTWGGDRYRPVETGD